MVDAATKTNPMPAESIAICLLLVWAIGTLCLIAWMIFRDDGPDLNP